MSKKKTQMGIGDHTVCMYAISTPQEYESGTTIITTTTPCDITPQSAFQEIIDELMSQWRTLTVEADTIARSIKTVCEKANLPIPEELEEYVG